MKSDTDFGPGWQFARFRVRYAETDAGGVVHHAAYLTWFEEGRSELSRGIGAPYSALERTGIDLVVTHVEVKYRRGARYDDEVRVWACLREVRSRRVVFEYAVVRSTDGELLAGGFTEHVAVERQRGRPARIPEPFLSVYREAVVG
jgi:acyl-CoA thioester hydrolase